MNTRIFNFILSSKLSRNEATSVMRFELGSQDRISKASNLFRGGIDNGVAEEAKGTESR